MALGQAQKYQLLTGSPGLDIRPGFPASAIRVDNPSAQWVYLPLTGDFIGPGIIGAVRVNGGLDVQVRFMAPPGVVQTANPIIPQGVQVTVTEDELVPSSGVPTAAITVIVGSGDMPTGTVTPFAGSVAPIDWLICDGAAYSRGTFAPLFSVIGTTYGAGDGSTTFNVPDLRGRAAIGEGTGSGLTPRALAAQVGEEAHVLSAGEAPAHNHKTSTGFGFLGDGTGGSGSQVQAGASFQLSPQTDTQGSGLAHNTMQPSIALTYIIRT